ncbi:HPP family protein [Streptosporangium sp. NPDC051022]|uniref:HPP family protein n=1 Tax=Streptosporangium sp. NPDC051022 TaxID=3155752 RepID=UPI00341EECF2
MSASPLTAPAPAVPLQGESRRRRAAGTAIQAGVCVAVPALIAWLLGQPFVFPSLGPTVYLALTAASTPAASPRNTLIGHLVSAVSGYAALAVTGLTRVAPNLSHPDARRVAAVAIAIALTSAGMLLTDATHPAGGATTLIVALGLLRTPWQLLVLMAAVTVTAAMLITVNHLARRPYPLWAPAPAPAPPLPPAGTVPLAAGKAVGRASAGKASRPGRAERRQVRETAAREAAETLAATMPTPLWPMARTRIVRLLARGDAAREAEFRRRLNASRTALVSAPAADAEAARRAVVDQWSLTFTTVPRADRHAPAPLRAFSDTFAHLLTTDLRHQAPEPSHDTTGTRPPTATFHRDLAECPRVPDELPPLLWPRSD